MSQIAFNFTEHEYNLLKAYHQAVPDTQTVPPVPIPPERFEAWVLGDAELTYQEYCTVTVWLHREIQTNKPPIQPMPLPAWPGAVFGCP